MPPSCVALSMTTGGQPPDLPGDIRISVLGPLEIRAGDTHRRTAAGVDDEPFVAGDDGGGGAGVVRVGARIAGAEEDDGDRDGTMNDE